MIDWSKVTDLRREIGDEDMSEIVDLFLEEADEAIDGLRSGVAPEELEGQLHFLKGSALNLGFTAFSELCATGEAAAAAGDHAAIDLGAVIDVYDKSKAVFLRELAERLAA